LEQKLTLRYDVIGDILYVETCPPYLEQESDELEDEMIGLYNPDSEELEGVGILFFKKWFPRGALGPGIELPFRVRGPKADPPFKTSRRRATAPAGSPSRARRR